MIAGWCTGAVLALFMWVAIGTSLVSFNSLFHTTSSSSYSSSSYQESLSSSSTYSSSEQNSSSSSSVASSSTVSNSSNPDFSYLYTLPMSAAVNQPNKYGLSAPLIISTLAKNGFDIHAYGTNAVGNETGVSEDTGQTYDDCVIVISGHTHSYEIDHINNINAFWSHYSLYYDSNGNQLQPGHLGAKVMAEANPTQNDWLVIKYDYDMDTLNKSQDDKYASATATILTGINNLPINN